LKNNDDYWIYAYEYNDKIKTMYKNKNSTMNKKLTSDYKDSFDSYSSIIMKMSTSP